LRQLIGNGQNARVVIADADEATGNRLGRPRRGRGLAEAEIGVGQSPVFCVLRRQRRQPLGEFIGRERDAEAVCNVGFRTR